MARSALMPVLCLVLGVGGGLLGGMLAGGPGTGTPPARGAAPDRSGGEDLARRVALLEERIAALPAAPAAPPPDQAEAPAADASIIARFERLEKAAGLLPEDLTRISTEELRALIRNHSKLLRKDHALAGVLEELLRRDLPEDEARRLRFDLGFVYRGLGEHAKEEALFRELARTLPQDTDDGQNAVAQLAWSRYHQGDLKDAGRILESLAANPAASDTLRTNCIYQVGRMAKEDGDLPRARAFLERLVGPEEEKVLSTQRHMITDAKQMLADMDGN